MKENSVASSFFWKFLERSGTQIINLIVQIVLARLIAPSEFGSLAVLIVFVNIANIFIQKGLSSSIVRKKEADDLDYDTALWASILISAVIYVVMFIAAPYISKIYGSAVLTIGLRVFSIQLFFGSLYCIQNAILVREMQFKRIFIRGIVSSIGAGSVGIGMAYLGYGLWALIVQSLLQQILCCVTAWRAISWKPKLRFSKNRLSEIYSFGGKILLSELLNYSVEGLRSLVIGKVYSTEALSYYDRGQTYPATLMRGVYDTIGSVLLPVFSRKQDDNNDLGEAIIETNSITVFLTTPIFVGMAAVADSLIPLLLTDNWTGAVPYFAIFSLYWIPYPTQGICKHGVYAKGVSDVVLRIEIIKMLINVITFAVALFISPYAIAVAAMTTMFCTTALYMIALRRIIHFSVKKMLQGMVRTTISVAIMYIMVRIVGILDFGKMTTLIIQVAVGIISYLLIAVVGKDSNLVFCINQISKMKKKRGIKLGDETKKNAKL